MSLRIKLFSFLIFISFPSAANIESLLLGVWGTSEDEGKTFTGFDEYTKEGKIISWGYISELSRYFELEASYQILGNSPPFSCVEITYSSEPSIISPGIKWCDEVVYIDAERFIYKSDDGRYNTLYRVSEFNPRQEFEHKL